MFLVLLAIYFVGLLFYSLLLHVAGILEWVLNNFLPFLLFRLHGF